MTKVSDLRVSLEKANCLIEEQQLRKEKRDRLLADCDSQIADHDWQMEENYARKMEEMKKIIEDMSLAQRGSWTLRVCIFQYLICLISQLWYFNSTFMSSVSFAFFMWHSWLPNRS